MGTCLVVSAIRERSIADVTSAIGAYAASLGSETSVTREALSEDTDAIIASRRGWTLVFWPPYFPGIEEVSQTLSRYLQTLISSVNVYDGDHWYHYLFRDGKVLDRFSSYPGYFTADPEEKQRLRHEWRADPKVIAAHFHVSPETIRPYLVDVELLPHPPRSGVARRMLRWLGATAQADPDERGSKAFPDDEHALADIWVFTDFWRRLGIDYEGGPGDREQRIRFSSDF